MKNKKCAVCGDGFRSEYPLCSHCMEKDGANYTASNYDLRGLSQVERQLVFLHACGEDISGYLDKTNYEVYAPDNEDLLESLSSMNSMPHFIGEFNRFKKLGWS